MEGLRGGVEEPEGVPLLAVPTDEQLRRVANEGDIRVVSRPGDTRFQVRLPLVVGEDEGQRPVQELGGPRSEK